MQNTTKNIKAMRFFMLSLFYSSSLLASGLSTEETDLLLTPTLTTLNAQYFGYDPQTGTKYTDESALALESSAEDSDQEIYARLIEYTDSSYTLTDLTTSISNDIYENGNYTGDDFIITKYLDDGEGTYTPKYYSVDITNIVIDGEGSDYIYYAWTKDPTTGNFTLKELTTYTGADFSEADFYVQYSASADTTLSSIDNIVIDSNGEDFIYYKWDDSTGNIKLLTTIDSSEADFSVQYSASAETALSNIDDIVIDENGSVVYYSFDDSTGNVKLSTVDDATDADFSVKYDAEAAIIDRTDSYSDDADADAVYSIGGDTKAAYHEGGAVYNNGDITKITASFISSKLNTLETDAELNGIDNYGGAIYNAENGEIGEISGYFIYNIVSGYTLYGGAIYNAGKIGEITSEAFIGNYAYSKSAAAYGGAIANIGSIDKITSDFIANYAYASAQKAYGGAIYNESNATIGGIEGNFIGNYVLGGTTWVITYGGLLQI